MAFNPFLIVILIWIKGNSWGKIWGQSKFFPQEVDISLEEQVFDLAFEVGLEYDIVFGVIVYSRRFWKTPRAAVMPLYESINREGIRI